MHDRDRERGGEAGESARNANLKVFILSVGISIAALTVLSPNAVSSGRSDVRVADQSLLHGHRVYKDTQRDELVGFVRASDAAGTHATATAPDADVHDALVASLYRIDAAGEATKVLDKHRCGQIHWLGPQPSANACAAAVLARPAAACSRTAFNFVDQGDGNCACAPAEARCRVPQEKRLPGAHMSELTRGRGPEVPHVLRGAQSPPSAPRSLPQPLPRYPVPNDGHEVTSFALANLAADLPAAPKDKRNGMETASGAEMVAKVAASCRYRRPGWYLTFNVGDDTRVAYGTSNQLIAAMNMANRAMRENRTLVWPVSTKRPIRVKHGGWSLDYLRVRFDMSEFFATFCVITADKMPPKEMQKDVLFIHPNAAYYEYNSIFDKTNYLVFRGIMFISIFANPRAAIKAAVAKYQREHLGPKYVAVHLRNLNPYEARWVGKIKRRSKAVADEMYEQFFMRTEYVAQKRAAAGLGDVPVFLGTDNHRKNLTDALSSQLGAKRFSAEGSPMLNDSPETLVFASTAQRQAMDEAMVDFLLMMNSTLFLGNDASTVTWNVVAERRTRGIFSDNVHIGAAG